MATRPVVRRPWTLALVVAVSVTAARPDAAGATINVTGDWFLGILDQAVRAVQFVQTGSSLSIVGAGTQFGTIDSTTGAFQLAVIEIGGTSCGTGFSGTVSPDGRTLAGTVYSIFTPSDCQSIHCACTGSTALGPLLGSRSPCGNGRVDVGEACDDGNLGRAGTCCTLACTRTPAGGACADDGNVCTGDVCDDAGACTHPFLQGTPCPVTDLCADGGACDGAGACVPIFAPAAGCTLGARHSVLTLDAAPHPRLLWTWFRGTPTSSAAYGDPTATTDYALCVYDGASGSATLAMEAHVPADGTCGTRPCWTATRTGFKYVSQDGAPDGVELVTLKSGEPGQTSITVRGGGPHLHLPVLPLRKDPRVTVQLRNDVGACWEADFPTARVNTTTLFDARSD